MLWRCAGLLICLVPSEAWTGAWPAPEGGGQSIVTNTRKVDKVRGLVGQQTEDIRNEVNFFAEYGFTAETTLGLVISGGFNEGTENGLADEIDAQLHIGGHLRHLIWRGENGDVASVEIGARFPAERWLGNTLGDDRPGSVSEAYVSVLYGTSWQFDWTNVFISSGLEFRARGEGLDEEVKLFATGGVQPFHSFMALLDVAWAEPLGELGQSSLKLTPSVALTLMPWVGNNDKKPDLASIPTTIQLGVTWDAYNPSDGIAFNMSVWRPF